MKKKLLYFGCMRDKGHFLFDNSTMYSSNTDAVARTMPGLNPNVLKFIDGIYVPYYKPEGLYSASIVPPVMIVAWNDYSVDGRPGSNSNLIGYGYSSAEEMIDDAYRIYPIVMNRQAKRPTEFKF